MSDTPMVPNKSKKPPVSTGYGLNTRTDACGDSDCSLEPCISVRRDQRARAIDAGVEAGSLPGGKNIVIACGAAIDAYEGMKEPPVYASLAVFCPACDADAGEPCVEDDGEHWGYVSVCPQRIVEYKALVRRAKEKYGKARVAP